MFSIGLVARGVDRPWGDVGETAPKTRIAQNASIAPVKARER